MKLKGSVAIVTGGGSGMGQTISRFLAKEGARVVVADVDIESARSTAKEIQEAGDQAEAEGVDVSDHDQVVGFVAAVTGRHDAVDILVNCAAVTEFSPAEEITAEQWRRMIGVDLSGVFYCCCEVGKGMIKRTRGKIINFSSTAGVAGVPYMTHYTAAKHGVVGLTKALAAEWGKYNINVNCICPGATLTSMLLESTTEQYRAQRAARTPLNRLATPEDQAKVVLFLASSESNYVTGNIVCTDGGIYAMAASTSSNALQGDTFRKEK